MTIYGPLGFLNSVDTQLINGEDKRFLIFNIDSPEGLPGLSSKTTEDLARLRLHDGESRTLTIAELVELERGPAMLARPIEKFNRLDIEVKLVNKPLLMSDRFY